MIERSIYFGVTSVFLWLASDLRAQSSLIRNGDFERPDLVSWTQDNTYIYPSWKSQSANGPVQPFPVSYSYTAADGVHSMEFNADRGNGFVNVHSVSLWQYVDLVPGASYVLTFSVGSYEDIENSGSVSGWGGLDLAIFQSDTISDANLYSLASATTLPIGTTATWDRFSNVNPGLRRVNWQPFSVQLDATASRAALIFQGGGFSDSMFTGLDSVELTMVPEPSAFWLLSVTSALWLSGRSLKRSHRGHAR
ncbi:MAG: hypothetical protein JNN07_08510 [Verrucomicrobiales bacterium]|nr:hypothetical protein [Verrucomicrobiales bacterium]